jgi:hypothetical protein
MVVRRSCKMVGFDTNVRIEEMQRSIGEVKEGVNRLLEIVKPEKDLWDNSDIIRFWKVSERLLASWRRKGLISYVQVNGKIWYTKEAREEFLRRNLIDVENARE